MDSIVHTKMAELLGWCAGNLGVAGETSRAAEMFGLCQMPKSDIQLLTASIRWIVDTEMAVETKAALLKIILLGNYHRLAELQALIGKITQTGGQNHGLLCFYLGLILAWTETVTWLMRAQLVDDQQFNNLACLMISETLSAMSATFNQKTIGRDYSGRLANAASHFLKAVGTKALFGSMRLAFYLRKPIKGDAHTIALAFVHCTVGIATIYELFDFFAEPPGSVT